MKKVLTLLITGLICGSISFFIGQRNGKDLKQNEFQNRSIEEIKQELAIRESQIIKSYLDGKAGLKSINEGNIFKSNYVQYFQGTLTNNASLVSAKDVRLQVRFFSKTGSKIGEQEIVLYEFILPNSSIEFKEKIDVPEKVEDFEFEIIDSGSEYQNYEEESVSSNLYHF